MLPEADEPHKIPSGYWKIIIKPNKNLADIKTAAFIFNQDTPRGDKIHDHLVAVNEIENKSRIDFLCELPNDIEYAIENRQNNTIPGLSF